MIDNADTVLLQDDLFYLLNSEPRLANVNIVSERKFVLLAEIRFDTIWMTPRNGCSGQGIFIKEPKLAVNSPNVKGPVYEPQISFITIQAGDLAFTPTVGAQMFAHKIARIIVDVVHHLSVDGVGTLMAKGTVIQAATDPEFQGTSAQLVTISCSPIQSVQTERVPVPSHSIAGGLMTLACSDGAAEVRYTTDLTFPGKDGGGNPGSQEYIEPFPVSSGDIIRFAAWRDDYNVSQIRRVTVP
jgi:hypothetical protein